MSKEKPILYKSDIIEMYDRSKETICDLVGILYGKDCSVSIHVNSEGDIDFSAYEKCGNRMYVKTLYQSEKYISYEEKEIKD